MQRTKNIVLIKICCGTSEVNQPPLALLLLGSRLKDSGYDVKILHLKKHEAIKNIPRVLNLNPLFIGLSVITGDPLDTIASFCKQIKSLNCSIPIVWGGIHPTLESEQCLAEPYVDFVVINEGDTTIVKLAGAIENNAGFESIEGLGYKKEGLLVINPFGNYIKDLDNCKMDWSLLDVEQYLWPEYAGVKRVLAGYITTRGCPHKCGFCYNQFFNKQTWRAQSAGKVIADINQLVKEYNIEGLIFHDDNFTVNKKRALQIIEGVNAAVIHIETRIDYLDRKFLDELAQRGAKSLFLGVESGSDRLLKLIEKGFTVKDIYEKLLLLKNYPFYVKLSFIVGIPTETLAEYQETLKLIVWCIENLDKVGFTIGFYLPYPGTPLFDLCVQRGFKKPERVEDWRLLDRWGIQEHMEIPWTEGRYLTSAKTRRIRNIISLMVNIRKRRSIWSKLLFRILKYRLLNDGNWFIALWYVVEDRLISLARLMRQFNNKRQNKKPICNESLPEPLS